MRALPRSGGVLVTQGRFYWNRRFQYEYQIYIKGEGSKEIRIREKREMYKEYRIKRFIEEEKGLKMRVLLE